MDQQQNTVSSEALRSYVEQVERIREDKKALSDEKAIMAGAKSAGFVPEIIRHVVKIRAQKPSDRQEAEALRDMYLAALGMLPEPPLFRATSLMSVDITAREQVAEALKKFVPTNGSIIIEAGGVPIRLTRDKDGNVSQTDVVNPPARSRGTASAAPKADKPEPPQVDGDGAEALGRTAARDDLAIIKNPFPFGDPRRPRWDLGWRKETGSDGMGPED